MELEVIVRRPRKTVRSTGDQSNNADESGDDEKSVSEEDVTNEKRDDDGDDDDDAGESNKKPSGAAVSEQNQAGPYQHVIDSLQEAHAEKFLISYSWHVEKAVEALEENTVVALTKAGIQVPHPSERPNSADSKKEHCQICFDEFSPNEDEEWKVLEGCGHGFCGACLGDYIADCARTKEAGLCICCPQHKCSMLLTQDEIQRLAPSVDVLESCLNSANENFVAAAEDLAFCPHPGCDGVVHRKVPDIMTTNGYDRDLIDLTGAVCTAVSTKNSATNTNDDDDAPLTYEGVRDANYLSTLGGTQPRQAHRFCFACGDANMHWPVPCDQLGTWKEKVAEEIGALGLEEGGGPTTQGDVDAIAQQLWMKANTRPCPKCKAPIEKNDGCNHMTCSNRHCRHEFCWICRQDWKLHNTETGGFFRCNRWQGDEKHEFYDTPPPPEEVTTDSTADSDQNYGTAMHSSRVAFQKSKEMGRFLHHYRRWNAHAESAALERNMKESVCSRLAPVVREAIEFSRTPDFDFSGKGLSFVHAAFTELLECRSILQHSYAFAFFRYPTIPAFARRTRSHKVRERERLAFEQIQSELEMITEQMSDICARRHLRASQIQIMYLTNSACEKRIHFQNLMLKLLQHQRKEAEEEAKRAKEKQEKQQQQAKSRVSTPSSSEPSPFDADSDISDMMMLSHPHHSTTRLRRLMDTYPHQHRRRTRYPYRDDDSDDDDDDDDFMIGALFDRTPAREQQEHNHLLDRNFGLASARMERAEEEAIQQALQASMASYRTEAATDNNEAGDDDDGAAAASVEAEEGPTEMWACSSCTYMNSGRGRRCAICGISR